MSVTPWGLTVSVKGNRPGSSFEVSNAERALDLLRRWDRRSSKKWRKAFELCVAAMEDSGKAEGARKAFEVAAKATGNLIER
jgi:hypothetical protein